MTLHPIISYKSKLKKAIATNPYSLDFYLACEEAVKLLDTLDLDDIFKFIRFSSSIDNLYHDSPLTSFSRKVNNRNLPYLLESLFDYSKSNSKSNIVRLELETQPWINTFKYNLTVCENLIEYCTDLSNIRAYYRIPDYYILEQIAPYEFIGYNQLDDSHFKYFYLDFSRINELYTVIQTKRRTDSHYSTSRIIASKLWPEDFI